MKLSLSLLTAILVIGLAVAQDESPAPAITEPAIETPAEEPAIDAAPPQGSIILNIDGIRKVRGSLRVRLYNNEEDFPSKDESRMFILKEVPVESENATITLDKLPFGNYGVVVHHDYDSDGKIDRTFYRAPKEPVACSRGAKGNFGPPNWEDAVVELNSAKLELPISFSKKKKKD